MWEPAGLSRSLGAIALIWRVCGGVSALESGNLLALTTIASIPVAQGSNRRRSVSLPHRRRRLTPVRQICETLERTYRNPRHGNKSNPLDELVYIILSNRTRDETFRGTFNKLKRRYPSWDRLAVKDLPRLKAILKPAGLGRLKARQIVTILRQIRQAFGRATLAPLKRMPDREAENLLTSLPGVAAKVAKCVLMYSLGRKVLPVDVHVHRVASRLGFPTKKRPDTSQDLIEQAILPQYRYGFHVNAVAHGRTTCLPRSPRCDICCISAWCEYYRNRKGRG